MPQIPYEVLEAMRNGGQQAVPYETMLPIQNGALYQPKRSVVTPTAFPLLDPAAQNAFALAGLRSDMAPRAGDLHDQKARAQRYMRGNDKPILSGGNSADFPLQQGILASSPVDENLGFADNMEGGGRASNLQIAAERGYPINQREPWNNPGIGGFNPATGAAVAVGVQAGAPPSPPIDRPQPSLPPIPQTPVPINSTDSPPPKDPNAGIGGSGFNGIPRASGEMSYPNPTQAPQQQAQGALAQPESNAAMMGLLSAGLGILANNTGHYGQAGPAIGKGGLIGVQTYLQQKQQEIQNAHILQQQQFQNNQLAETQRIHTSQISRNDMENKLDKQKIADAEQKIQDSKDLRQGYTDVLKNWGQQGKNIDIGTALEDPSFHRNVASFMYSQGKTTAAKQAMDVAKDLEEASAKHRQITQIPDPGGRTEHPAVVDLRSGQQTPIPGAASREIFNPNPLVTNNLVGEKAYDTKAGGNQAEMMDSLQKAAIAAPQAIARFDKLGDLLKQVNTGKYTGATTDIKAAAKGAGIDLGALGVNDNVAPVQAAQALSRALALELRNPSGGAGMPGSLSDSDRKFLESMIPSIESDPKAWPVVLDTYRKLKQRDIEIAKLARDYAKQNDGRMDYHFIDTLNAYSASHPLFGEQKPAVQNGPAPKKIMGDADYNRLPSGATYIAPDGSTRTKK